MEEALKQIAIVFSVTGDVSERLKYIHKMTAILNDKFEKP